MAGQSSVFLNGRSEVRSARMDLKQDAERLLPWKILLNK